MSTAHLVEPHLAGFQKDFNALRHELAKVVVGQADVIEQVLIAAVAGGHVLIEGVPGLGKTLLVQTLADILQLRFSRIQFTPDLTPSDLLGTFVVMETAAGRRTFEFQQGPIFSNLVLADQINRGLPKTQSALLQAMEGEEINVSTETFQLPQPFFVVGTQNPLEMEGTFPLPETEIDRFFFKLVVKGPSVEEIDAILERTTESAPAELLTVVDGKRLLEMREIARKVPLAAPGRRGRHRSSRPHIPTFPQPDQDPQRLNLALQSSAQRIGASGKFQHDAPVNCLLRIETVRVPADREKRENEAKMPMKIRLKQVENRYNTHTTQLAKMNIC